MFIQSDDDIDCFEKTTLSNGLRIVTSTMPHTRSVSICLMVGVGSRYEDNSKAGISHLIEHLLFKGTYNRPTPVDISGPVESVGGDMNAGTDHESTFYWCKVPEFHLYETLDLLVDMLRNSRYTEEDIEKEKHVIYEEQRALQDDPAVQVEMLTDKLLWPNHSLGREISGTQESVSQITREDVLTYVNKFYNPENIVISVAGNGTHYDIADKITNLCAGWNSSYSIADPSPVTSTHGNRIAEEYRTTQQVHISIALPGISNSDPDRYALDLLNIVFGDGMSSRLFQEIRENQGLAYDVNSTVINFSDCGALVITLATEPTQLLSACSSVLAQIKLLKNGISKSELEGAKQLVEGRLLLRMEDSQAVSTWIGGQELLLGRIDGIDQVIKQSRSVSIGQITAVANRLLTSDKLCLAVVGPCKQQKFLEKLLGASAF